MKNLPLVTVICLCYQHEKYVNQALTSVFEQTYPAIELIVVDDASPDQSTQMIAQALENQKLTSKKDNVFGKIETYFFPLSTNQGNCKAFNIGLAHAKGKYIIDLAADDLLLPDCIEKQVVVFEKLDESYAVVFSDLYYIDKNSKILYTHFQRDKMKNLLVSVPQGDVYRQILAKSFLSAPSMMIRKKVLEELNGYDETLSYEDYDFWVRSARRYKYFFINDLLVKKRILKNSLGRAFYLKKNNKHLLSTLKVHQKAFMQNQTLQENLALAISVRYHLRLSFYTENFELVPKFAYLLSQLDKLKWIDNFIVCLSTLRIPVSKLYRFYLLTTN
jgi:glycosyltransferase involved in cell wall biosynthesis